MGVVEIVENGGSSKFIVRALIGMEIGYLWFARLEMIHYHISHHAGSLISVRGAAFSLQAIEALQDTTLTLHLYKLVIVPSHPTQKSREPRMFVPISAVVIVG